MFYWTPFNTRQWPAVNLMPNAPNGETASTVSFLCVIEGIHILLFTTQSLSSLRQPCWCSRCCLGGTGRSSGHRTTMRMEGKSWQWRGCKSPGSSSPSLEFRPLQRRCQSPLRGQVEHWSQSNNLRGQVELNRWREATSITHACRHTLYA